LLLINSNNVSWSVAPPLFISGVRDAACVSRECCCRRDTDSAYRTCASTSEMIHGLLHTSIVLYESTPVAQPGFGCGGGGTGGLGNGSPPGGSRVRAPGGWFGGGIASRKLIAAINDIWLPNHAQFCVFSSTAQPGIFLRTQFRVGRAHRPLAAPLVHPQRRRELGGALVSSEKCG